MLRESAILAGLALGVTSRSLPGERHATASITFTATIVPTVTLTVDARELSPNATRVVARYEATGMGEGSALIEKEWLVLEPYPTIGGDVMVAYNGERLVVRPSSLLADVIEVGDSSRVAALDRSGHAP